jgi:dihydropyrimidinase
VIELVVRNGLVVSESGADRLDILVENGRIAALTAPGSVTVGAGRSVDATGRIVLPGGVEPHAHMEMPLPEAHTGVPNYVSEAVDYATRAAVFGGVTTVVDFVLPGGIRPVAAQRASLTEAFERRRQMFAGHSYTDYSFHLIVTGAVASDAAAQAAELISGGISSFKVFMTNPMRVPNGELLALFAAVGRRGGIMSVHAEDAEIVDYQIAKLVAEGRDEAQNMHLAHTNVSEDLAFRTIITIAEHTRTAAYLLHTSAKEGVAALAEARNRGVAVYGETLHNYLEFTCDHYSEPGGMAVHTYPSVKYDDDRAALRQALLDGTISTVGTDHIATSREVRLHGKTITTACGGHNGIETRLPVVYTRFVAERGMPLTRFAEVIATNPARILGLYPRKGVIRPGSDADLVLLDPGDNRVISASGLHGDSDYSIWDGFRCAAYPVMTILRGKVVVEDGRLTGESSDGQFVAQRIENDVLSGTAL